jgi:hypothetical protein
MDDDRRPGALHECGGTTGLEQVVAPVIDGLGGEALDVPLLEDAASDQAARAGDQGEGGQSGASRSRSEMTATGSGQSMPTVGSSQRRLRALAALYGVPMT